MTKASGSHLEIGPLPKPFLNRAAGRYLQGRPPHNLALCQPKNSVQAIGTAVSGAWSWVGLRLRHHRYKTNSSRQQQLRLGGGLQHHFCWSDDVLVVSTCSLRQFVKWRFTPCVVPSETDVCR